jgi:hypothetical protein
MSQFVGFSRAANGTSLEQQPILGIVKESHQYNKECRDIA